MEEETMSFILRDIKLLLLMISAYMIYSLTNGLLQSWLDIYLIQDGEPALFQQKMLYSCLEGNLLKTIAKQTFTNLNLIPQK